MFIQISPPDNEYMILRPFRNKARSLPPHTEEYTRIGFFRKSRFPASGPVRRQAVRAIRLILAFYACFPIIILSKTDALGNNYMEFFAVDLL